ncbi:MAG: hypothetical protein CO186_12755 [Zetaproteobacteria bacterium CG_4_9_14_3_um_filter_49_83]|nr:MAG: hypothetical protein AUJ56_01535 [Zetaproteobacteria bacterium CG1_02_49_23]PIQ33982.1 MAG: hypothetical protein COW62_03570 [Zetaproteobacteria bacterium CG17_big_fil_post_rev_8_21_14_2_50_50_13]PIV30533.1 MAG: hypothetical protein COS35_06200 [Zetaproteobacteria bacterium CG02_land_8_20_14_3_00_50_9]PIY56497.1 MAG: hypothetical protein COZ00_03880 [Zetaproteobacteria bacterium CG_4_10_14_0_8_um_filter_49_80]PJA33798.1 MAG: hypothetical protein CO186_12755 [Zetaproteobacteria bacterium
MMNSIQDKSILLAACFTIVMWAMPTATFAAESDGYCMCGSELSSSESESLDGSKDSGKAEIDKKIEICHVSLGKSDNAHSITIGQSAWPAHEKHGDYVGECDEDKTKTSASRIQVCTCADGTQGIWTSTSTGTHEKGFRELRGQ